MASLSQIELKSSNLELRKQHKILVIDDEAFEPAEYLDRSGFNITTKKDIEHITDVEPYPVLVCDIHGVGKNLGGDGTAIITQVNALYPLKYMIVYSSSTFDPALNKYFNLADDVPRKNQSIQNWSHSLDTGLRTAMCPKERWLKTRGLLLKNGAEIREVARLENEYIKSHLTGKGARFADAFRIVYNTTNFAASVEALLDGLFFS